MIVKGHGLRHEGSAFDEEGRWLGEGASFGHGFCGCGDRSSLLASTAARKRWHRERKAAVFSRTMHQ